MKKLTPFIVIGIIVVFIVILFLSLGKAQHMIVIREGNVKQLPLKMELGKYQDSDCGMVIDELEYASQVVSPEGKTWFFHDHGDFVHWLQDKPFEATAKIWVMSRDTHKWIDGRKAYYTRDENTPMGFGFGAYEHPKDGSVDFATMKELMLSGETLKNPKTRKEILGI